LQKNENATGAGEAGMDAKCIWLSKGERLSASEAAHLADLDEDEVLQRRGVVQIATSHEEGTTVKWAFFAPNWGSLYYVMETLYIYPGPYHLNFFLAGWFRETYDSNEDARQRIHELVAKSDIHILSRTFVHNARPSPKKTPPLLQDAMSDLTVKPDFSVDLVVNDRDGRLYVERIGPQSAMAKLFGLSPVSFPCMIGGSYDQVVSACYPRVIKSGEPHYDHVVAAMSTPDRRVVWVPYQRVVLPHRFPDGRPGVTVVSEITDAVDIRIV
jgi:hypothetical protein